MCEMADLVGDLCGTASLDVPPCATPPRPPRRLALCRLATTACVSYASFGFENFPNMPCMKSLQRQIGDVTLVRSQKRRAVVVLRIYRISIECFFFLMFFLVPIYI